AFHVAVEIQAAFAQQLGRLLDYLVALDDFFADIQQTDSGLATLVQRTDQRSTHDRELQEVLCRTVHVRAKIQHRGGAALNVGDRGGNGGTIDAVQRLEHVSRHRHECAGIACGYAGIGATVLDRLYGDPHGGILFASKRNLHGVVHEDDFRSGQDFVPAVVCD